VTTLVIGGTSALGGAVLAALGDAPHVFTYFDNQARAAALASAHGGTPRRLDLRDGTATRALVSEISDLDAVIYCVTQGEGRALADIDDAAWSQAFELNVHAAFRVCQAAAARMSGGGNLVLAGFLDGTRPVPAPAHFAAAQGALAGLVRALGKELGPRQIRINLVLLGVLDEGPGKRLAPDLISDYQKFSAQARLGTTAEVAQAMVWLARENSYITGQIVPVNGGL
jgi:3-oxoacyl-[acyl-carrier protein] reductase